MKGCFWKQSACTQYIARLVVLLFIKIKKCTIIIRSLHLRWCKLKPCTGSLHSTGAGVLPWWVYAWWNHIRIYVIVATLIQFSKLPVHGCFECWPGFKTPILPQFWIFKQEKSKWYNKVCIDDGFSHYLVPLVVFYAE